MKVSTLFAADEENTVNQIKNSVIVATNSSQIGTGFKRKFGFKDKKGKLKMKVPGWFMSSWIEFNVTLQEKKFFY